MKLFLHYLRSKALKIGAFLLFALLFLVSFRLYHLPLAAVWYPSALCAALGLVILLLDFRRVRQRHLELQQILKSLPTLPQTLPQPQAVLEEDYRALTRALLAQQRTLETQLNSRYQDMLDYYTLWAHQIKTPIASMRLSLQQEDTPKARQLLQELGHDPSPEEIAEEMNMPVDKVREILKIAQEPVSLETPIGEEEDSHLGDFIPDEGASEPSEAASYTLLKEQLVSVLSTLTPREEKVLKLRFGLEDGRTRTLEEVGKEFNVTRERIRQIEAKALRKLRHPSRSKKLKDFLN